jgi:hypothetical protein
VSLSGLSAPHRTVVHSGCAYPKSQVRVEGDNKIYKRDADSGFKIRFHLLELWQHHFVALAARTGRQQRLLEGVTGTPTSTGSRWAASPIRTSLRQPTRHAAPPWTLASRIDRGQHVVAQDGLWHEARQAVVAIVVARCDYGDEIERRNDEYPLSALASRSYPFDLSTGYR